MHTDQGQHMDRYPRMVNKPYVVVIFGRTGAGISSLVNLINGHPISNEHPDAKSARPKIQLHPITFRETETDFRVYEMPGFGGRLCDGAILDMIHSIQRKEGIDLFLYCLRTHRPTMVVPDTLRRIRYIVPGRRIPMIAVVTELEKFNGEGGMEAWWDTSTEGCHTNGTEIERMYFGDDRFDAHSCVTTLPLKEVDLNQTLRKRRDRSEEQVRRLILEQCKGHQRTGK